ncbi:MAG: transglycosylase SLT domain-containing protein, partial [Deltaproteobacteria bacterium]|nr:transglycosylase SLT domain-containing protein [Deltaproteobacteria bacterium]
SPARATGTWQFMSFTGTRYGLRLDNEFDERLNFERSTESAIRYLKMLKQMFGKWTLAMAAYNCGEGCVNKEIQEQGVADYFRLKLPNETERYVYRIAAIKIIMENPTKYGYYLPKERAYQPYKIDVVPVNLYREIHFTNVAKALGLDYKALKELNPEILGRYLPRGAYTLNVPAGLGQKMVSYLNQAATSTAPAPTGSSEASGQEGISTGGSQPVSAAKFFTARPGDTLNKIALQTGVPAETLKKLNAIDWNHLAIGQKIRIAQ